MATIAELMVKIGTKSTDLTRGLSKARKSVKQFADAAKKTIKIAAAAMTAAFVGVSVAINRSAESIDKLAKTADKLGVTTQALQKLQFQAELSGVSSDTLNMALQRMVRRVSEAAQGTGEAVNALKELGIDAKALAQLSPDKQFEKVARAMRNVGAQGDKVRLAMKLFDSEGVALVNTLGSNLAKAGREFDELGGSITRSQAAAVEAFNDSKTRLGVLFTGLANQVTANVSPAFTAINEQVLATIKEMGGIKVVSMQIASGIIGAVSVMIRGFSAVIRIVRILKASIESIGPAIEIAVEKLKRAGIAQVLGEGAAKFVVPERTKGAKEDINRRLQAARAPTAAESTIDKLTKSLGAMQEKLDKQVAKETKVVLEVKAETGTVVQEIFQDKNGIFTNIINNKVQTATENAARITRR